MFDTFIGKLAVKPLLIACLVLGALLIAASIGLYVQNAKIDGLQVAQTALKSENAQLVQTLKDATSTNEHQTQTVHQLTDKLREVVGQRDQAEEANRKAVAARNAAERARQRAYTELQRIKADIYENDPTCAAWGARPVCPAIDDRLRQQWEEARRGDPLGDHRSSDPEVGDGRPVASDDRSAPAPAEAGGAEGTELPEARGLLVGSATRGSPEHGLERMAWSR